MLKALEKALFIAESDTRQRRSAPAMREIESKLIENILAQSLALQIIRSSRKPSSKLLDDLLRIEAQVGEFVGRVLKETGGQPEDIDLKGVLAGALSFVPRRPVATRRPSAKMLLRKAALTALDRVLPDKPVSPVIQPTTPPLVSKPVQAVPIPEKAARMKSRPSESTTAPKRSKSKASARAQKPSVRKKAR